MMTSPTKLDRHVQLRKAAILVATLDAAMAERLLADLPSREAAAVRTIVSQLEDIDPSEYQAVVADFRQGISAPQQQPVELLPTQVAGVELDASLLARLDDEESLAALATSNPDSSPWQALSDADTTTLVEMLSAEQPQTIAVVLARLETSRAAELISRLAPTLQIEVLTRLSELDPADEQSLEVVESQLAGWITAQRQRRQRMSAGRELVQRILQDTSESQRTVLLARLGRRNPALTEKLVLEPTSSKPLAKKPIRTSSSVQPLSRSKKHSVELPINSGITSVDPLSELESLDDQALLRALQEADRQTVMLALAGASEGLMKRIVHGLPRRRAKQFRQQVRAIGPTRLGDMLAAQRELVRCSRA